MPRTALLVSILLAAGTTFYDGAGRVTGSARTDEHGVVHFYDPAGRSTGTARPKE